MAAADVFRTLVRELDAGRHAALCVVVATRGSTPQPPGAMLCVDEAARITGTLGGGCVEADVRRQAHQLLTERKSKRITFNLDHDFGYDDGMICGGRLDVAVGVMSPPDDLDRCRDVLNRFETGRTASVTLRIDADDGPVVYRVTLETAPRLIIAGGGHISRILAQLVLPLGFRITVIDDRVAFAGADRFPPPMATRVGDIASTLKSLPIDENTYVVIVTRGHKHDEEALHAVLDSPAGYIGMIGSRRKVRVVFDDLLHRGATEAQLARVHAPIGVNINAVTTEEIALSIAAELVAVRRADRRSAVAGPTPVAEADR